MRIAAYEILKSIVINRIKNFFTGLDEPGGTVKYKREVLSKHKSALEASLLWHQEMQITNENDRRWEEHEAAQVNVTGVFFKAREWYAT
jgi:hypothetical protein